MISGTDLFLILAGFITGLIDSVAGGGGLIALPSISLVTGPGVAAIATNKIVGSVAAFSSLFVYFKNGLERVKHAWTFALWVGLGALIGSRLAGFIPPEFFLWALLITCPIILIIVWRRDFLLKAEPKSERPSNVHLSVPFIISGLACGIYDGVWGPGGGTFMLLSLILFVKLPLLPSLLISKMANTASATVALASFAQMNQVQWSVGLLMAFFAGLGSYIGAEFVSRKAIKIFRPVLTIVVVLLLIRVGWTFWR